MRLTPPPLKGLGNPTRAEEYDLFYTASVRNRLSNVVRTLVGHGVMVIDGPWGSGKSTFTRLWRYHLESKRLPVVWFDAFEADHHDDAFLPMMSHITSLVDSQDAGISSPDAKRRATVRERLIECAERISPLMHVLSMGIALQSQIHLGPAWDGFVELTKGWKSGKDRSQISLSPKKPSKPKTEFEQRLARAESARKAVDDFQSVMKEVVQQLTNAPKARPLVFIIDELDRCRPRFALQVLERIKHLFAIDGIFFVVVTHLQELEAMVQREYGLRDPARYLDKFYQVSVDINRVLSAGSVRSPTDKAVRIRYLEYLANRMDTELPSDLYFQPTLKNLIEVHRVSLRSIERIVLNYGLYNGAGRCSRADAFTHLAAALCVMRSVSSELYQTAVRGELTFRQAMAFISLDKWDIDVDESTRGAVRAWWWLLTDHDEADVSPKQSAIESAKTGHQNAVERAGLDLSREKTLAAIGQDVGLFSQPREAIGDLER